jgi:hypothetical protein
VVSGCAGVEVLADIGRCIAVFQAACHAGLMGMLLLLPAGGRKISQVGAFTKSASV